MISHWVAAGLRSDYRKSMELHEIAVMCKDYFGVSLDELRSKRRFHYILRAKTAFVGLCVHRTNKTMKEIGLFLGGMDHSSVVHLKRKHFIWMEKGVYPLYREAFNLMK